MIFYEEYVGEIGSRWQKSCNDNPVDQEKVRTQDMSNGQPLKGDKNLIKKIDTKVSVIIEFLIKYF